VNSPPTDTKTEHLDVLIVGAGLSGVGAACHLVRNLPGKSFAILEARDAIGGTWDLFRYPGIRSDSDMFTLGYSFAPWEDPKAIADGPSIRRYIVETARAHGIDRRIRFGHRVVGATWSSADARWTVEVERPDGGSVRLSCGFLYGCTGYYDYDNGYTPQLPGVERFQGTLVHPQHWPEELDYGGKRVVVIGSGATAVTLVPAMAEQAAHVTMLQRSPSYVVSLPARDPFADAARGTLPKRLAYAAVRWKNVLLTTGFYKFCRRWPEAAKKMIRSGVERRLPAGYDVDTHFRPGYEPWDQRLCVVPDGDLFTAISAGTARVVTDRIETFTEGGIRLASGDDLEADIVVTATGLNLKVLGGITLTVDGREVIFPQTVSYKGMMFSGVPNLALTLGYTNASWTLKADLIAEHVCRLLAYMDARGARICTPRAPDPALPTNPFLDLESGYVLRSIDKLPKQGARPPWRLHQNYPRDVLLLRRGRVDDEGLEFSNPPAAPAVTKSEAEAAAA
jgi:cation diffusion facilitator CzcD-associated flavoprotein CzcO